MSGVKLGPLAMWPVYGKGVDCLVPRAHLQGTRRTEAGMATTSLGPAPRLGPWRGRTALHHGPEHARVLWHLPLGLMGPVWRTIQRGCQFLEGGDRLAFIFAVPKPGP